VDGAADKQRDSAAREALPDCLALVSRLKTAKPSAKPAHEILTRIAGTLASANGSQLLLAWLLLKGRRIELVQYGLDYSLKQAGIFENPEDGHRSAQLLQALLDLDVPDTSEKLTPLERAFFTVAGRRFMRVHESGGTEWFNKERYEELLEWLSIISLMERAASKPADRTIAAWLGRLATENRQLIELAAHAGYRTKLLLQLMRPVEKNAKTTAVHIKKPARKKTDVQGTARTHTAKTPDNKIPR
jgi:hypothetical protein